MRPPRPSITSLEFDAFSVAVGSAVIAGGLALLLPYLDSLTAALTALACAGWAARRSHDRDTGREWATSLRMAGLLAAAFGAVAFFLLPGPLAAVRGLALGFSLVPLWLVERHHPSGRAARPGGET